MPTPTDQSPWSNKYEPPLEDGTVPSEAMWNLDIEANEVFSVYRDQYYEGGISSVYIWEDEDDGFIACFLIKKGWSGGGGSSTLLLEQHCDAVIDDRQQAIWNFQLVRID